MTKRTITDFVISLLLLLFGIVILVFPIFHIHEIEWILFGVLIGYAFLKLVQFIITVEDKDYEGIYTALISLLVGALGMYYKMHEEPLKLAMALLCWTTGMSLIKLKKADYYHDAKNRMWKFSMVELAIFIVSAILTSMNLYYSPQVQTIVLGFFFFIHGVLELIDPIVCMVMKEEKLLHENSK